MILPLKRLLASQLKETTKILLTPFKLRVLFQSERGNVEVLINYSPALSYIRHAGSWCCKQRRMMLPELFNEQLANASPVAPHKERRKK